MIARKLRSSSPPCAGWKGFAFGLAWTALLALPGPVFAEPLTTPVSFNTRFAAVETPDQIGAVPAKISSDAAKETGDSAAKPPQPLSAPRPLDARANYAPPVFTSPIGRR